MNDSRADKLVRELMALYAKYGAAEFEAAIRSLEAGGPTALIARLASVAGRRRSEPRVSGPRSSSSKRLKQRQLLDTFVAELESSADGEQQMLAGFVNDIAQRRLLRSPASLREYATSLGISERDGDRYKIAIQIGELLAHEAPETRKSHMLLAAQLKNERSSLQQWSDLIVKNHD
jgi:hypothetical protein